MLLFSKRTSPFNRIFMKDGDGDGDSGAGGGGGDTETWHVKLPEDIRADASLIDFKDETEMINMPVNVARSYINTKKMVGRDKIPMPKSDEEWTDTYKRLGRPDTAEAYTFAVADTVTDPQARKALEGQSEWLKKISHKIGLSDKQAGDLFTAYSEVSLTNANAIGKASEEAFREAEISLRSDYGNSFEGKMVLMNRAIDNLDNGTGLKDVIGASGLGKHPAFIRTFVKIGEMMAEDLGLDKSTGELAETPENLSDQKAELMKSPAYLDANDPTHESTVRKVAQLIEKIHGSQKVEPTSRQSFLT